MCRILLILTVFFSYSEGQAYDNRPSPTIAKFNSCRDENLTTFQKFVDSRISKGLSCKSPADCVYIPFGEGYVMNRQTADQQFDCIHDAHQAYFNYCLSKLPGKSYPLNELKFFDQKTRPTGFSCEESQCVARFDLTKKGPVDYTRRPAVRSRGCAKDLKTIFHK